MARTSPISIHRGSRSTFRWGMRFVLLLSLLTIVPCAPRLMEGGDNDVESLDLFDVEGLVAGPELFADEDSTATTQPHPAHRSAQESVNMRAMIAHGILAAFAWAVLAPFAIASAWFRRLAPTGWIYMHVLANLLGFLFTLLAFVVAVIATNAGPSTHFSKPHHIGGLCVTILATLQVLAGFLRPPVDTVRPVHMEDGSIEYQKDAKIAGCFTPREIWYFAHKGNGLVLLGMSVFQITSGLRLFAEDFGSVSPLLLPTYWVICGVFGVGALVMRVVLASYGDGGKGNRSSASSLKNDHTVAFDDASQDSYYES